MLKKNLIKYYLLFRWLPYFLFGKKPSILTFDETIDDIISSKKSFARFGDGEIRMMLDSGEIGFQKRNLGLTKKLQEVMKSTIPNLLIGLPNTFKLIPQHTLHSQIFWYGFNLIYSKKTLNNINLDRRYGDTNITRFYMMYKNKSAEKVLPKIESLKKIWENQDILFLEGQQTRLGIGNDLFLNAKSIQRIICPSENAFDKYESILELAEKYGRDKLIIIALGPTATILAYDLAKNNYWALDLGHVDVEYMWFLQKALVKSPVKGKYVNEAGAFSEEMISSSEKYNDQIIARI